MKWARKVIEKNMQGNVNKLWMKTYDLGGFVE